MEMTHCYDPLSEIHSLANLLTSIKLQLGHKEKDNNLIEQHFPGGSFTWEHK